MWAAIWTPLVLAQWELCLRKHPDEVFNRYILTGIREGFRIGFKYGSHECKSAKANMKSAIVNQVKVDEYLAKQVRLGRVAGPIEESV